MTTGPDQPGLRASDRDREQVVAQLRDAVGEGTLTLAEAEERITAAYAARYRRDLAGLTADLPTPQPPPTPPFRPLPAPLLAVVLSTALTVLVVGAIATGHVFWPVIPLVFLTLRITGRRRWRAWAPR